MNIILKSGKNVDITPVGTIQSANYVSILDTKGTLRYESGEYCIIIEKATKGVAAFCGVASLVSKRVALRLEKSVYDQVLAICAIANDEKKAQIEADRQAMIATRPQKKVLMFSGWYLSDPAKIVTLFESETGGWYVKEEHVIVSELQPIDASDMKLADSDVKTGFESRCYEVSDSDVARIVSLNTEKLAIKEGKVSKKEQVAQAKTNAVFAEAKRTNTPQLLRRNGYDHTRMESGEEYTSVLVEEEYAMPDGSIKKTSYDTH